MGGKELFGGGNAEDITFQTIREAANERALRTRLNCERLWSIFEPHADHEFHIEIRKHFAARYWEMYLTVALIDMGFEVTCPKPGPDVGILFDGRRIWFEATSPTRGADGAADQVPAERLGVAQYVPNERIVLRYLNSISEKRKKQCASWLERGIIADDACIVIALNPRQLGHEYADTQPPRILQAAFARGNPYMVIDRNTLKQVGSGYEFRNEIRKNSGAPVSTAAFHLMENAILSGFLCSRIDVGNQPSRMGDDFQLVANPNSNCISPPTFRLRGTHFRAEQQDGRYLITPESEGC